MASETGTIQSIESVFKKGKLRGFNLRLYVDGFESLFQIRKEVYNRYFEGIQIKDEVFVRFDSKISNKISFNVLTYIIKVVDIPVSYEEF